jgi:hypothetical protein
MSVSTLVGSMLFEFWLFISIKISEFNYKKNIAKGNPRRCSEVNRLSYYALYKTDLVASMIFFTLGKKASTKVGA